MKATVEEQASTGEELVPVAAERDLALLEQDLVRLEREPIEGIVATRGVDRSAGAYRRVAPGGEPLLVWAKGKSAAEIRAVGLSLLEALAVLHERGLMLGGIKAEGIAVEDGKGVLVDLARVGEEPARLEPGASSAREALAGARCDRRTDLHDLGAIFQALLPQDDLSSLTARDPQERAPSASVAMARLANAPTPDPSGAVPRAWHSPLVGRTSRLDAVLEQAQKALASPAAPDAPGIIIVQAGAGFGRTRFLDEALVRLAGEAQVARASGVQAGTRPLAVLASLLARLAHAPVPWSERARTAFARLGVALPGQRELWAPPPPPVPESPEEAQEARLLLADAIVSTIVEAAARGPLVLAIDDLDRCDAGSRFVVRHLARRLAAARKWLRSAPRPHEGGSSSGEGEQAPRVALLASTSARPGEKSTAPRGADETGAYALDLQALAGESYASSVELEPLDEDALATIGASLSGDTPSAPRARELARAAKGSPGLVVESVRAGFVSSSLLEALHARVEALEPLERSLLVALVAIGREADGALAAEVAGHELGPGTRHALVRLVREGLARRAPGGYSVRPVIQDLLVLEKTTRHAALAAALARRLEPGGAGADPVAVAELAAATKDAALLERAAPAALDLLATRGGDRRAASLHLALAEALLARGDKEGAVLRFLDSGAAFHRAGQSEAAQEVLLRTTHAPSGEPLVAQLAPEVRARAWRQLGVVRAALGLADASHAAFRRARAALARARAGAAGLEHARVLLAETEASLVQGELDLAVERGEAGLKTLRELAASGAPAVAPVRSRLLAILGHVALLRDRPKEAETLLRAALAIDERHENEPGAARIHQRLGGVALARGDVEAALSHWRSSLAIREKLGDRAGVAHVHANLSLAAARTGDLARASALLRRSLRIREEMGDRRGRAASLHNLGYVAACRGELAEAVAALEECLKLRDELGDRWYAASARNNLGQVLLELGRTTDAEKHLEEALAARRGLGDRAGEAASLANLADLALRRGDFGLAIEREALARRMREGIGGPEDAIDQLRRGARLEVALGNTGVAIDAAFQAVKLAKENALPLQEGPSRLLLGEALARAGRLDRGKRELERARSNGQKVGDGLTARRAEVELGALLVARGFPEDARALLDSEPVPFTTRAESVRPAFEGPLRARELLLRSIIELARPGGEASLARKFARDAYQASRAGEERELVWRALRAESAAAEKEGDEGAALELAAAAQEIVEALLANVPEARREAYLRDVGRAAALRGDAALAAILPPRPAPDEEHPRIELRGTLEDDAPTRGVGRRQRRAPISLPPRSGAKAGGDDSDEGAVTPDSGLRGGGIEAADFAAIIGLNRRLVDERDTAHLYAVLVESALRLCRAERAFLAVFGATEEDVTVLATRGLDEPELRSSRQKFSRRVAKRAADTGELVVTADVHGMTEKKQVIGQGLRSVLAAPVRTHDGRKAVLYLDHRFQMGIFGARELRLVEAIADQCALAIGRGWLEERVRPAAHARPTVEPVRFHGISGRSRVLRKLVGRLAEAARTERPVLVTGPRGVGKEHAARALHSASGRASGPFVVLDLRDAGSAADLASALRGSKALPDGALGAAASGTLLLKALDEAKPAVALALAHELDSLLARKGGMPRLVGTTSASLRVELDAIFAPRDRIEVPSLASRREDVPAVAAAILERICAERGENKTLTGEAVAALAKRPLKGEARELVASIVAAWARAGSRPEILAQDLPPARKG